MLSWLPDDADVALQSCAVEPVVDRHRLTFRLSLSDDAGEATLEQHGFFDVDESGIDESRIDRLDLVCSGIRRAPSREGHVHYFDAGALGCGDGLPREFRRRIATVPVGDVLQVTAHDPSAREDLPALARMLGHDVLSNEETDDGSLVLTVERKR
jgi:TusA-related sulfurtransferase